MDVDDNFYDELSSFIPTPTEYDFSSNDLDDFIGSTVSQLDSSSLDLNTFMPPPPPVTIAAATAASGPQDYVFSDLYQSSSTGSCSNDFDFNFGNAFSAFSSPNSTSSSSSGIERTPSTSSAEGAECFDDLINFINEDNIKIEELTRDNLLEHTQERNTPSPTGSCSSGSSGSSTSGVHSDASDTSSRHSSSSSGSSTADQTKLRDQIDVESAKFITTGTHQHQQQQQLPLHTSYLQTSNEVKHEIDMVQSPAASTMQQQQSLAPPPAIVTMPIKSFQMITTVPPIKVEANTSSPPPPQVSQTKLPTVKLATPTTNGKPKTIFLSSNDFKALMQKMNSNGGAKGAKINGSVNAQIPKIIMKTANGKVLTGNKIMQPPQLGATKMAQKAPMMILKQQQQQQQQQQQTAAAAVGQLQPIKLLTNNRNSSHVSPVATTATPEPISSHIYRGMIDEKMFKKQQRMIKNRESASMSRKKKKEYVVALETRINKLEQENYTLKGENATLRNQLVAFAKTCKCRNGNVSEFVLNSLNAAAARGEQQHVKIAPKPSSGTHGRGGGGGVGGNLKQRMTSATVKKNVAVLFAMAFMVTLNAGNFHSYLNKQNMDGDGNVLESMIDESPISTNGRRLLWVDTEEEFNEKLSRSKRQVAEMEVPPLHFLRPTNRSSGNATEGGNGHINATGTASYSQAHEPSPPPPPLASIKCGGGGVVGNVACANQTEYSRLARNLHKWIDGNDYHNLSMQTKFGNNELLENPHGFKLTPDYMELTGKRKLFMDFKDSNGLKRQRLESTMQTDNDNDNDRPTNSDNSLKLYKPQIDEEYLRLFKGIKRQDDRFYVLSFNMEHILLPASGYNKSVRPKMSLLLPTGDPTRNGDIVLMQIDCEVFNTTQLELKSHMIPSKLRPNITKWHSSSSSSSGSSTPKSTDVANNETQRTSDEQQQQQQQLKQQQRDKLPLPREKPRVRTYFMVGPKNQAAAAASQEKPRLVQATTATRAATTTDPSIARNGTLYARMRETVRGEFGP